MYRVFYDPAQGVGHVELEGKVDGAELHEAVRALCDLPDWKNCSDVLWDCSGVTELVVAPGDIPKVVQDRSERTGREAIVATRFVDELCANLYAAYARVIGKEVTVHADRVSALHALGREALPAFEAPRVSG